MPLSSMRQILDHAAENDYGVPAFNINNMEQVQAIMRAAQTCDAPVILQASRGARSYAGDIFLRHLIEAAIETWPNIPIAMHQDHGNSPQTCMSAIASGFSSVMMDGSLGQDGKTPLSYEDNIAVTKEVVDLSHRVGVTVEGELGCLGSLETGNGDQEDGQGFEGTLDISMLLTDPDQAQDFVARTGVDALAVAIGTSHGAYKFSRQPTGDILAMDVIAAIHKKLPNTHLVMHGSSSVPQELQDLINDFGGKMPQTYGVPVKEIVDGIKNGVRKINIDTDCRMAITGAWRQFAAQSKDAFDPRQFSKPAYRRMQDLCQSRYETFGASGMGSKIKVRSLSSMVQTYVV